MSGALVDYIPRLTAYTVRITVSCKTLPRLAFPYHPITSDTIVDEAVVDGSGRGAKYSNNSYHPIWVTGVPPSVVRVV